MAVVFKKDREVFFVDDRGGVFIEKNFHQRRTYDLFYGKIKKIKVKLCENFIKNPTLERVGFCRGLA